MNGLASAARLRLQVFSTSWRFHPPRAWRPCFVPHPLMGLYPSELCSSRAAVRRLRRPYPHGVLAPPGSCSARESAYALRPEGRRAPRSSPGLCALQGFLPRWPGTAFTAPPLTRLALGRKRPKQPAPQGVHSSGIGSSPKRPPALLGFAASTLNDVRFGRGSGVASSGSGVRRRPLSNPL
jgi:hypothetical protein